VCGEAGDRDAVPGRVELLDEQEELFDDRLYLGAAAWSGRLKDVSARRGTVVLLAEMEAQSRPAPPEGCLVLAFSCSLARLHNVVAQDVRQGEEWSRRCAELLERCSGAHAFLDMAARACGGAVVLADPKGQLIDAAGLEEGSCLQHTLSTQQRLPPELLRQMFPTILPPDCRARRELRGGGTLYGYRPAQDGAALWLLLVEEPAQTQDVDVRNLCDETARGLRLRSFSRREDGGALGEGEFHRFWEDVMERRLIHRGELTSAMSRLPFPVSRYNRIIVLSFRGEGGDIPYRYILSRLRDFFPRSNMTLYQQDIVILYSYDQRLLGPLPGLDRDGKLTAFLKRYHGFLMVGNGTKHPEGLGSMYLLCKRTIDLAYLLRESADMHIFYSENYLIYSIIDLCVQRYLDSELNDDILYLTHPAVPALTRYDREHHTDLRDVLFYYLLNDCNLTATAAALYMHRNTVNHKVRQIKDLTGLDLEEPRQRQRLLLSCQIMRYYEIVMQRQMQ